MAIDSAEGTGSVTSDEHGGGESRGVEEINLTFRKFTKKWIVSAEQP
jgi:hypothetical protein